MINMIDLQNIDMKYIYLFLSNLQIVRNIRNFVQSYKKNKKKLFIIQRTRTNNSLLAFNTDVCTIFR